MCYCASPVLAVKRSVPRKRVSARRASQANSDAAECSLRTVLRAAVHRERSTSKTAHTLLKKSEEPFTPRAASSGLIRCVSSYHRWHDVDESMAVRTPIGKHGMASNPGKAIMASHRGQRTVATAVGSNLSVSSLIGSVGSVCRAGSIRTWSSGYRFRMASRQSVAYWSAAMPQSRSLSHSR